MNKNVLFITIDQLRADCLRGGLAEFVPTPNLDRFAAQSMVFGRHYTVTNPCGPARASLLTGLYAHTHKAVRNGSPLSSKLTNLALEARKLGYEPLLFGYTDTQLDPQTRSALDPDLQLYENVLPGFREICEMRLEAGYEWPAYLKAMGYDIPLPLDRDRIMMPKDGILGNPTYYSAEDSDTAYLTNKTIEALDVRQDENWFAHVTYIRPHPPFAAPDPYHTLIDPEKLPMPKGSPPDHPFIDAWFSEPIRKGLYWGFDGNCKDMSNEVRQKLRATYLGLVAEVDMHIGRLLNWLDGTGQKENTLVIITADHGEMLGDFDMWGKDSIFEQAFHVPLMISMPESKNGLCEVITESIDVAPTIIQWLDGEVPISWQGQSLLSFFNGSEPEGWRKQAHCEIEFNNPISPTRFERFTGSSSVRATINFDKHAAKADFENVFPNYQWRLGP